MDTFFTSIIHFPIFDNGKVDGDIYYLFCKKNLLDNIMLPVWKLYFGSFQIAEIPELFETLPLFWCTIYLSVC